MRTRDWSSLKTTSNVQCKLFSIIQSARTACATCLALGISGDALIRARPASAGANTSTLHYLTRTPGSLAILRDLLQRNPTLAISITGEALCRGLSPAAGSRESTSALYWLTRTPNGRRILQDLFRRDQTLIMSVSGEALCRVRPARANVDANTSALYYLAESPDGRRILKDLLRRHEGLASAITAEVLDRQLVGIHRGQSIYSQLNGNSDGREILSQLYAVQPGLRETLERSQQRQSVVVINQANMGLFSNRSSSSNSSNAPQSGSNP
ncbi:MAG: hypothetical protein ACOVQX_06100 [Legionella sp.]